MDDLDLEMYVNKDEEENLYQCFTRQERYLKHDAPFNVLEECCDVDQECSKPGHMFKVHIFEASELSADSELG